MRPTREGCQFNGPRRNAATDVDMTPRPTCPFAVHFSFGVCVTFFALRKGVADTALPLTLFAFPAHLSQACEDVTVEIVQGNGEAEFREGHRLVPRVLFELPTGLAPIH